ncbi:MAG: DUF2385 domain-containing protein, partial [Phenylobacterium sp.]|nr:DUF2385 domain-containing protein [Phenylobacterium sp.]
TEAPDAALDRRLKEAFNSGFASRRAEFPECSRASRIAEAAAARRGQALAASLASVRHRVDPREAEARRKALEMEAIEQELSLRP